MNAHDIKTGSNMRRTVRVEITYSGDRAAVHDAILRLSDHIVQTLDAVNRSITSTDSQPLPEVVHVHLASSNITTNTTDMWPKDVF